MKFLSDYGISNEIIQKVISNNSEQTCMAAEWNIERVVSSLNYLEEIGIKQINKVLINRFDILLRGRENLEKSIKDSKKENIVDLINEDIKYIYFLD